MITRAFGCNIPKVTSLAIAHGHFAHTVAPEDVVFTEEFKKWVNQMKKVRLYLNQQMTKL